MIAEAGSIAELETRQHMAVFNYREILRQRITEQEYARSMQQQVISNVTVTPGEVMSSTMRLMPACLGSIGPVRTSAYIQSDLLP